METVGRLDSCIFVKKKRTRLVRPDGLCNRLNLWSWPHKLFYRYGRYSPSELHFNMFIGLGRPSINTYTKRSLADTAEIASGMCLEM
jgi:hypothetical protein